MNLRIESFHGHSITPYIETVARLRIEVFREYPYLYEGDMEYEKHYLQTFSKAKDSILLLAFHGEEAVGASTGLPLKQETPNVQAPFLSRGYDPASVFYLSESVLKANYRGRGAGAEFFRLREAWARQLGRFNLLAFCAVVRPEDHPLKPEGYVSLGKFWERRGFGITDMFCFMSWKDLGEPEESAKPLRFWVKSIEEQ